MQTLKYILLTGCAVIATFLIHEFAHWDMGQFLGYDMVMTLNTVYPVKGSYDQAWHYTLISAIGPLITLSQAFVMYFLIKRNHNQNLYPFLFVCFYMELLSGVMNLINPNDLGRISTSFGLPLLTLPIIFIVVQSYLLYKTTKRECYSTKFILLTLFSTMFFSSVWILMNNAFLLRVIGN